MINYEFEKGTIKTGVAIDLGTNDEKFFEDTFGRFIRFYDDRKDTKEELEPVHVFATVTDEDDEYRLIFTKDVDEIIKMEMLENEFRLACMDEVNINDKNRPINFISEDGFCTWVEEEYIEADGTSNRRCHYLDVSWI